MENGGVPLKGDPRLDAILEAKAEYANGCREPKRFNIGVQYTGIGVVVDVHCH